MLATGCQSPTTPAQAAADAAATKLPLAAISIEPAPYLVEVRPDAPVTVTATNGKLTSVVLTGRKGRTVEGNLAADGSTWTSNGRLTLNTTYTVLATAVNADGVSSSHQSEFTTVKPKHRSPPASRP
jgi:hypothetical protein